MKKLLLALSAVIILLLGIVGHLANQVYLAPVPVLSNWNIKGYSSLRLQSEDPAYYIAADGSLSPPTPEKLERSDQIIIMGSGQPSPKLVERVNSVAFIRDRKIYVLELSTGELRSFKE